MIRNTLTYKYAVIMGICFSVIIIFINFKYFGLSSYDLQKLGTLNLSLPTLILGFFLIDYVMIFFYNIYFSAYIFYSACTIGVILLLIDIAIQKYKKQNFQQNEKYKNSILLSFEYISIAIFLINFVISIFAGILTIILLNPHLLS